MSVFDETIDKSVDATVETTGNGFSDKYDGGVFYYDNDDDFVDDNFDDDDYDDDDAW